MRITFFGMVIVFLLSATSGCQWNNDDSQAAAESDNTKAVASDESDEGWDAALDDERDTVSLDESDESDVDVQMPDEGDEIFDQEDESQDDAFPLDDQEP